MQALLYADLGKKTVSLTPGGSPYAWPKLVQGDDIRLKLRLTEQAGEESVEVFREVQSMRITLGRDDVRPESGWTKLKFGGGSSVAGVNLTGKIQHNATAEQIATAINALSSLTSDEKPVDVRVQDGSWLVTLKNGAEKEISAGENALFPVSFVRVQGSEIDEKFVHDIRLIQAPVAFTEAFARVVPEAPAISALRDGGETSEAKWNEVQVLTVPPTFRGAYEIRRGFKKTPLLSIDDGVEEIAEALKSLADEDGVFNVTNPTSRNAHIEFAGTMAASNQDLLEVVVFDAPPGDLTFALSLKTAEMSAILRRRASEKLPLDIECVIEDEQDSEVTYTVTFRVEGEVQREVGWEGMAASQNIDWLRPPLPKDYIPFTPDQVAVGVLHESGTLGNGVLTVFTIDHGLESESVLLLLRVNNSPGAVLRMGTDYTWRIDDNESITVTLLGAYAVTPPAAGGLGYTILAMGQASQFNAHTHTIGQIVGLQTVLDAFGADIDLLKSLVPTGALAAETAADKALAVAEWVLPALVEVYPTRTDIASAYSASQAKTADAANAKAAALPVGLQSGASVATPGALKSLSDIGGNLLPRAGGLLPALHDATTEALSVPLPTSGTYEGRVFKNQTGSNVDLPGGGGRRGVILKPNEHAAVLVEEGRVSWYRVAQAIVGETSWYPTDFERELFMFAVNSRQLRLKKTLTLDFGFEVAILKANTKAQWVLVIEHGAASEDTSPMSAGTTCTANAANNVVTATAHGLTEKTPVKFSTTDTLPGGLSADVVYYLRDVGTNAFKLATIPGGPAVDITSTGSGTHTVKAQTGANLAAIAWNAVPILEHRIHLTPVACTHTFGCVVKRALVGGEDTLTVSRKLYGSEEASLSVPASANFFLRGRLTRFDTENSQADPKGLVALMGLARAIGGGEAEASSNLGKATII